MLVVDASVLVVALLDDGEPGRKARSRLRGEPLCAPALVDLEVISAVRRLAATGAVTPSRADDAVVDLAALPVERVLHRRLLHRCWALRDTVTPYDAAYVALAEALTVPLLTADARLAGAPGIGCTVELLAS